MVIGTTLEWYDVLIYAQAAALIFSPLFFPSLSPATGTLAAFATYGVGYLARPLGAVVFGHIGDRYGRRAALVSTLMLMGLATTAIGFLPTYATIGLAAPLLLVTLRLLQGLGAGAEYAGAFVMLAEMAPVKKRGFLSAIPGVGIYTGMLLASAVAAIVFTLPKEVLFDYAWRIPFLFGAVLIVLGLYFRMRIAESPVYSRLEHEKSVRSLPVVEVFRRAPKRLFLTILLTAPIAFNAYIAITYAISYIVSTGASPMIALISTLIAAGFGLVSVPVAGYLSDKFGRKPVYLAFTAAAGLSAFPYFMLLSTGQAGLIWLAQGVLMGCTVFALTGAQAAYLAELFDPSYRFSGVALAREISTAALAAPAPIIATGLAALAGGEPWLIAGLMVLTCVACFIAVLRLPETRGIDMTLPVDAANKAS